MNCFVSEAVAYKIFGARYSGHLFSRLAQKLTYHDQTNRFSQYMEGKLNENKE